LTTTVRRRLDNLVLRWQGRLDSEWADRVLPWAAALALFVLLAALALAQARSLDGPVDLASHTQAAWLIREGVAPVVTVGGTPTNLLAQQATFLFYPMLLATYVLPIIPALLVLQAAVLAVAVVPLWKVVRRLANLRVGAAAAVVAAYACYPVMHNLNLEGFHPEVVAVPGLLAAFYLAAGRRWLLFGLCCAVVVASRADLGLAVAGLGVLLFFEGKRRAGAITAVAALAWTVLAALVIQPALGDGSFPHLASFASYGDGPGSVFWGMLTHPLDVLGDIVAEVNLQLLLLLLAPLLFLPLLALRYLAPVVPLQLLYFVADVPDEARFGPQTVAFTAFAFVAAAFALARIGRLGVEKVMVDRRILAALVLASAIFFVGDAASSPYREPWDWGAQDVSDAARHEAADLVGPGTSTRASASMLQLLAERPVLYPLALDPGTMAAELAVGVDAIVLDEADLDGWSRVERRLLWEDLEANGFHVTYEQQGIVVFARDGFAQPPPDP
jgi:uncharacterized membrane protein